MKWICKICKFEFNEPDDNKQIKSLLTRFIILTCPKCQSHDIDLTELSKLRIQRQSKIKNINKSE